jgi:indolepyruvate ferredoxin oxidoreductase beta subunit
MGQAKILAFACCQHRRLGTESPVKILSENLVKVIANISTGASKKTLEWSSRDQREQQDIEAWLLAVTQGLQADWALGSELAQCGQLIKGYGSTNERAKRNLQHILVHVASAALNPSATWRAQAVAQARAAALQDEEGVSLNNRLTTLGAATLPVAVQPLRFVRHAARRP